MDYSNHLLQLGDWLQRHLFGADSGPVQNIALFGMTFAAALVTQVLFWDIDPDQTLGKLIAIVPGLKGRTLAPLLIFLSIIGVGALIVFKIYDPKDARQAALAGVGWYTAMRSVRSKFAEGDKSPVGGS